MKIYCIVVAHAMLQSSNSYQFVQLTYRGANFKFNSSSPICNDDHQLSFMQCLKKLEATMVKPVVNCYKSRTLREFPLKTMDSVIHGYKKWLQGRTPPILFFDVYLRLGQTQGQTHISSSDCADVGFFSSQCIPFLRADALTFTINRGGTGYRCLGSD